MVAATGRGKLVRSARVLLLKSGSISGRNTCILPSTSEQNTCVLPGTDYTGFMEKVKIILPGPTAAPHAIGKDTIKHIVSALNPAVILAPSKPGSSKSSLSFRFPQENPLYASSHPHSRYKQRPSYSSQCHHPKNIG